MAVSQRVDESVTFAWRESIRNEGCTLGHRETRELVLKASTMVANRSLAPNETPLTSNARRAEVIGQLTQLRAIRNAELGRELIEERVQLIRHISAASIVLASALEKLASQQAGDAPTVLCTRQQGGCILEQLERKVKQSHALPPLVGLEIGEDSEGAILRKVRRVELHEQVAYARMPTRLKVVEGAEAGTER